MICDPTLTIVPPSLPPHPLQTFVSKTQRFKPSTAPPAVMDYHDQEGLDTGTFKGDPTRLGPGSYMEQDTWSKKPRHPG